MRVLYVCTANICRSASAQQLLREAVAAEPGLAGIEVRSAGTAAVVGAPGCSIAPALAGHASVHRSQQVSGELVAWADLILAAARDHRPAIAELEPRSRVRTFTIRQAGRIADWIVEAGVVAAGREGGGGPDRYPPGDPRTDVPVLPTDLAQRWAWLVGEMDAARAMAPARPDADAVRGTDRRERRWRPRRSRPRSGDPRVGDQEVASPAAYPASVWDGVVASDLHPDDVPDPHLLGLGLHPVAYEQIRASTDALVRLFREVASTPPS
jgi:protein-tyrosine-phosphatase